MSKTAINGIVSSQPMSHLRAVVCLGRLTDPSTDFAEPGYLSGVRNQSERQALTVRYHTASGQFHPKHRPGESTPWCR